jgi:wyosine [tRNA(Phe)-imidazoG37] synthetase (radical SAM superfamily)
MIVFGYVPSRRLGRSLGVNNLPKKFCTYSCVYCQIGRTNNLVVERRKFYDLKQIYQEVDKALKSLKSEVDYITFVPNGEPTLDVNLGKTAEMLRDFGRVAIITNSSLIWRTDVKEDLMNFDLVSFKVDAVDENTWRFINRPHKSLKLSAILENLIDFRREFKGKVLTETMLIDGVEYNFSKIAEFLRELKPDKAYISIPIRPPAEKRAKPAKESVINEAYQTFSKYVKTELLMGLEGLDFGFRGDVEKDLLSITSVHPLREKAIMELLKNQAQIFQSSRSSLKRANLQLWNSEGRDFTLEKFHFNA